jgi:hypothetical protein
MILTGFVTIVALHFLPAPYGRYSTPHGWGVMIPAKIAWFIMESPNIWVSCLLYMFNEQRTISINNYDDIPNCILLFCFLLHYFHRSIIYPLKMSYVPNSPMPITVMILAFTYCLWNGTNQGLSLLIVSSYKFEYVYDWKFIIGLIIFFFGMYVNIQSDDILLNLKKRSSSQDSTKKQYYIPHGGMFKYVSCANFFGEILEWIGFAIACQSLPAFAFAFYVVANVGPRALEHHKWYLQKFGGEYPRDRKAVIPFML